MLLFLCRRISNRTTTLDNQTTHAAILLYFQGKAQVGRNRVSLQSRENRPVPRCHRANENNTGSGKPAASYDDGSSRISGTTTMAECNGTFGDRRSLPQKYCGRSILGRQSTSRLWSTRGNHEKRSHETQDLCPGVQYNITSNSRTKIRRRRTQIAESYTGISSIFGNLTFRSQKFSAKLNTYPSEHYGSHVLDSNTAYESQFPSPQGIGSKF